LTENHLVWCFSVRSHKKKEFIKRNTTINNYIQYLLNTKAIANHNNLPQSIEVP